MIKCPEREDPQATNYISEPLTPEQEAKLEPLRHEYNRTLTNMVVAQRAYAEAYGALVVATRKLLGEIPE